MASIAANMYPVGIHETCEVFPTQKVLALELGYSTSKISQAISGIKPIQGLTIYKAVELRTCTICKETKSIKYFRKRKWKNYLGVRLGYSSQCKTCLKLLRKKRIEQEKQDIEKFRQKHRLQNIKTMYGLSKEQYERLLSKQKGCCAICNKEFVKTPHVDHNHLTGKVRGLLCHLCNTSLGGFGTIENLINAIKYIKVHNE